MNRSYPPRVPPRQRSEGSIETLPSGRLRVRVYAGPDPVTGKPRYLREIVDTKLGVKK